MIQLDVYIIPGTLKCFRARMIVWMTLAKLELLKIRFLVKGRASLSCIVKFVRRFMIIF